MFRVLDKDDDNGAENVPQPEVTGDKEGKDDKAEDNGGETVNEETGASK